MANFGPRVISAPGPPGQRCGRTPLTRSRNDSGLEIDWLRKEIKIETFQAIVIPVEEQGLITKLREFFKKFLTL